MKNFILTFALMLIGSFSLGSELEPNKENEKVSQNSEKFTTKEQCTDISACCTVTVEGADGDATVRKCRTTREDACNAAYNAAFIASN